MRMIAKSLLVVCLFIAVPLTAFERDCPTVGERSKRLLSPRTPVEVIALYDSLVPLARDEQQSLMEQFSPALRQAVWTHHLRLHRRNAVAMTPTQRSVIDAALSFLAEELLDGDERGSEAVVRRQERLDALKFDAEAAFPPDRIRELFYSLAQAPSSDTSGAVVPLIRPDTPQEHCNCASWYDCSPIWPSVVCFTQAQCVPTNYRCGFFWSDPCFGLC